MITTLNYLNKEAPKHLTTEQHQTLLKWGWYQSIYGIAKGDVTKFDDITRINVHTCLLYLAFEKEKIELERLQIKKR